MNAIRTWREPPIQVLETKEDLLDALANPGEFGLLDKTCDTSTRRWHTRSNFLVDLIREIQKTEYAYNGTVQRLAESRLGIDPQNVNGSTLSLLVYNAQGYALADKLIEQGFVPLTDALVAEAFAQKKHIQTQASARLTIREIQGKLYLFKPRIRRESVMVHGQPARIIDPQTKQK